MLSLKCPTIASVRFVRHITIQQPSTVSTATPVSLDAASHDSETKSQNAAPQVEIAIKTNIGVVPDHPQFKTIGTPATTLSVSIPPSIPVTVKKGSVMSVYSYSNNKMPSHSSTNINNSIKSTWKFFQPLRRLFLSGETASYQRIIGTVSLQLLISAYTTGGSKVSSLGTKSFVNLSLDGTFDWALFNTSSLQCYTGNSLNVDVKRLPKDLQYGLKGRGYTWINGRGLASVVGNGNVFNVSLGEGEEIRVDRNNIFAVTMKDVSELSNGSIYAEKWNISDGVFSKRDDHEKVSDTEPAQALETKTNTKWTNNIYLDNIIGYTKILFSKTFNFFGDSKSLLTDYVMGTGNYVVIRGPRTVLIETGAGKDNFVVNTQNIFQNTTKGAVEELEEFVKTEEEFSNPTPKNGDNFGVVRIENGKVKYENIDNFDKEVKRIEGLMKK